MRCLICDANDKWTNVDECRIAPKGMHICNGCGFVSYPSLWKTEDDIKAYYRKEYRKPPTISNLFTGQRKLHFHREFLTDLFLEWQKKGKKTPQVSEIGAAFGMALAWVRNIYPGAEVSGTELTESYRLNAWHEFKIKLTEDFDYSKKYDLIMSYKVAEHQWDADKYLRKYVECLADDGYFYISVPTWFSSMASFGLPGFDIEYYYDTNHINVWTEKLFETLLKKVGLEIVKKDNKMYDSTYLCKRNDALMNEPRVYEDSKEIKERMDKIKKAFLSFTNGNSFEAYDEAIKIWPDYPAAHQSRAETMRKDAFEKGWPYIKEHIIDYGLKCCPNSGEIYALGADMAMRCGLFKEAIEYAEQGLKIKPGNPVFLSQLMNIMREMAIAANNEGNKKAVVHYIKEARGIARHLREVSTQHLAEATTRIYEFNAHLPMEENAAS